MGHQMLKKSDHDGDDDDSLDNDDGVKQEVKKVDEWVYQHQTNWIVELFAR